MIKKIASFVANAVMDFIHLTFGDYDLKGRLKKVDEKRRAAETKAFLDTFSTHETCKACGGEGLVKGSICRSCDGMGAVKKST
jgi:hypothetical protein